MVRQRNFRKKTQILCWLVCLMALTPTMAWTQAKQAETFSVSGIVTFKENNAGDIILRLITKEQYIDSRKRGKSEEETEKKGIDFSINVSGFLILKIGEKELQEKQVPFVFENIPKGNYFIEGFQDIDGDGLYKHGKEPDGQYRKAKEIYFSREAVFKARQFEVDQDVSNIMMRLK